MRIKNISTKVGLIILVVISAVILTNCNKEREIKKSPIVFDSTKVREGEAKSENNNRKFIGKAIKDVKPISIFDIRLKRFINSIFCKNYNKNKFPELIFKESQLVTFDDNTQAIVIPSKKKLNKIFSLIGYLEPGKNQKIIFGIVSETESVGNIGFVTYFQPNGIFEVKLIIKGTQVLNIDIGTEAAVPFCSFKNCYKQAKEACGNFFGCDILCTIGGPICPAGIAACCGIYVGLGCRGDDCN